MIDVSAESDKITVNWTTPTTDGVPTSYNVSINDSSSPVVVQDNGSPAYTNTFTGLTNDTLYNISVAAINCLGSKIVSKTIKTCACIDLRVSLISDNNKLSVMEQSQITLH